MTMQHRKQLIVEDEDCSENAKAVELCSVSRQVTGIKTTTRRFETWNLYPLDILHTNLPNW